MTSKDFIKLCFDAGVKHFKIGQLVVKEHPRMYKHVAVHINMRKHCWKDIIKICNHNKVFLDSKLFRGNLNTNINLNCGNIYIDEAFHE